MILLEAYFPRPRRIRVVYDTNKRVWTYRCSNPANKVPFIIHGLNGALASKENPYFEKAPYMGVDAYPFFNPEIDTLHLVFDSCDGSFNNMRKYFNAMKQAVQTLTRHSHTPGSAPIRRLRLDWCTNMTSLQQILGLLRRVKHLEKVTVAAHDHANENTEAILLRYVEQGQLKQSLHPWDSCTPSCMVPWLYPFEVTLFDSVGLDMEQILELEQDFFKDDAEKREQIWLQNFLQTSL